MGTSAHNGDVGLYILKPLPFIGREIPNSKGPDENVTENDYILKQCTMNMHLLMALLVMMFAFRQEHNELNISSFFAYAYARSNDFKVMINHVIVERKKTID